MCSESMPECCCETLSPGEKANNDRKSILPFPFHTLVAQGVKEIVQLLWPAHHILFSFGGRGDGRQMVYLSDGNLVRWGEKPLHQRRQLATAPRNYTHIYISALALFCRLAVLGVITSPLRGCRGGLIATTEQTFDRKTSCDDVQVIVSNKHQATMLANHHMADVEGNPTNGIVSKFQP